MRRLITTQLGVFLAALFIFNFTAAAEELQLTNNNYDDDDSPKIHNGQVFWRGRVNNELEIFFYDGAAILQISNNNVTDDSPVIHSGQKEGL